MLDQKTKLPDTAKLNFTHNANQSSAKRIGFVVIVDVKTGKVLMQHRRYPIRNQRWGFFGGKIDDSDKSIADGVRREAQEEAGIFLQHIESIDKFMDLHGRQCGLFIAFVYGRVKPILCNETIEAGWFDLNNLPKPLLAPIQKQIPLIRRAIATTPRIPFSGSLKQQRRAHLSTLYKP